MHTWVDATLREVVDLLKLDLVNFNTFAAAPNTSTQGGKTQGGNAGTKHPLSQALAKAESGARGRGGGGRPDRPRGRGGNTQGELAIPGAMAMGGNTRGPHVSFALVYPDRSGRFQVREVRSCCFLLLRRFLIPVPVSKKMKYYFILAPPLCASPPPLQVGRVALGEEGGADDGDKSLASLRFQV